MASLKTAERFLLIYALLVYTFGVSISQHHTQPHKCSNKGERFKPGQKYDYRYEVTMTTGLTENTTDIIATRLSCLVSVSVPRKCELIVKAQECKLHERTNKRGFIIKESSSKLAREMKRNPVYLHYNEGEVINHRIAVSNAELQHIVNIKRGIISSLQLKTGSSPKTHGNTVVQQDVFGSCPTHMSTFQESDSQLMETYRDLLSCNLSHVSKSQAGHLSFIKSVSGSARFSPINELTYPFRMDVRCNYSVMPSLTIKKASCIQRQVYSTLFSGSDIHEAPTTLVSQNIKLEAVTPLLSRTVDHSLFGRHWKNLAMEFAEIDAQAYLARDVLEDLEQTTVDFLGQGNENLSTGGLPAESFRMLVDTMRETAVEELKHARHKVFSCHPSSCRTQMHKAVDPKMLQSIEERIFYNGLMSCGTESCLAVLAACVRDGLLPEFEARSIISNMGLFYEPSIKVIHIIYEHCRHKGISSCWLSLSAMISRLTNTSIQDEKVAGIIFEAVSYLHVMIKDKCDHDRPDTPVSDRDNVMDNMLLAIKAMSNMGELVKIVYNEKVDESKSVTSTLLHCVTNKNLKFFVVRSAVQAIGAIGLEASTLPELLRMIEDEKRPVELRIEVFDILVLHKLETTLDHLVKVMDTTNMENLKTYMRTRFTAIVESLQPGIHGELKVKLREILQKRNLSGSSDNILYKSRYLQYSQHFTIPLTLFQLGGFLTVKMVYTPTSNIFHSLKVEVGSINDKKTLHFLDVTLDVEGMDTLLEIMKKQRSNHKNSAPLNLLDLLSELKKLAQEAATQHPMFADYSNRIKQVLMKIFQLANIQKMPLPTALVSLKVFGYEMGSITSHSLLMMVKQIQLKNGLMNEVLRFVTQNIQSMLLRAFMITDSRKILPTVSGFPLETRVSSSVVTKSFTATKTAFEGSSMHTDFILRPSVSATLDVSMTMSLAEYMSSGITMKVAGAVMWDWAGNLRYQNIKKPRGLDHVCNVTWDLREKLYSFFSIRSDKSMYQNGEEIELTPSIPGKQITTCLPEVYAQLLGHRICLSGSSHGFLGSSLDPTSLLMNSFRVEGIAALADDNLKEFSLSLKYHKKISQPQGFYAEVKFEGKGTELSRQVSVSVNKNYEAGALEVSAHVPDAGLTYSLEYVSYTKMTIYSHKFSSVLSQHARAVSSFIVEIQDSHISKVASLPSEPLVGYIRTRKHVHLNVSMGSLSVDLLYRHYLPVPTYWVTDVVFAYHCKPALKLLYALHPDPKLAATQDHTSRFTYFQETHDSKTSFSETWTGHYSMGITLPGQNISMVTDMVADLHGAQRVTDLYWQHRNKTEFIHMNSSVHNQSTTALFNFDYFLHLHCKDRFDLDMEGHVRGPRMMPLAMLNISTDIRYAASSLTSQEESSNMLSLLLPQLQGLDHVTTKKMISGNESAKVIPETSTTELEGGTHQEKLRKKPFWESLNWSIAIDTQVQIRPQPEPGTTNKGMLARWFLRVTSPRGENQVMFFNGSFFKGNKKWMKFSFEDNIDEVKFNWQVEHYHDLDSFHHHHNWSLEETSKHSFDRAFNFRVHFEHYLKFEYDMILYSPWTNATHHLNYTKISDTEHEVRAFAQVHSLQPAFDLIYHESSDVINKDMTTQINMTSTLLDYKFELTKVTNDEGVLVNGQLHLNGKLEILRGERKLSLLLAVPKSSHPVCDWTYRYQDGSGVKASLSLIGPRKMKLEMKTISSNEVLTELLSWTSEVVESRHLQHTIEFTAQTRSQLQPAGQAMQKVAVHTVKQLKDFLTHNILSDFKDKVLPFVNKRIDEFLKMKLQQNMAQDPASSMTKVYKLALGAVDAVNTIWAESPLVKISKVGHIDKAFASSIQSLLDLLSNWILHPPLFVGQFAQIYIHPVLHQNMKSRRFTFSTPLLVLTPGSSQKMARHGVKKAETSNNDVAVILGKGSIKTFDGYTFNIVESSKPSCTYLLGGDFRSGQFGLTYTSEGLLAFSSKYGFLLAHDGSVYLNDVPLSYLPYSSPDGQFSLSLHGGEIQLSFQHDLGVVTFNEIHNFYLINMDTSIKNVSLGLLGTNNHESGDDLTLADGTRASNDEDFQNAYELTNDEKCQVSLPASGSACNKTDIPACKFLSPDIWPSCEVKLNSHPFLLACQKAECKGKSGCSSVLAYIAACRHQGVKVVVPDICATDQVKLSLDVVIVQSLHRSVIREQDLLHALRPLIASLAHLDLHVGIVTYGGKGKWKEPRTHFVDGRLLEKGVKFAKLMHVTVESDEIQQEADAAILAASELPFRATSNRIIILVHQRQETSPENHKDYVKITEILKSRGIILITASTYPELATHGSKGFLSSTRVLKSGGKIPSPQDIYSSVVMANSGMWLDLDVVSSLDKAGMKDMINAFIELKPKVTQWR